MHIPIKVDYGVRALIDLALHSEEGSVRSAEIARRNAIPESFLEQILHALARHGLTQSQRGPQGGHSLAKDPSEISLGMVMQALGEMGSLVGCQYDLDRCLLAPSCAQRDVWLEVEEAIRSILNGTTIADLVYRARAARAGPGPFRVPMYPAKELAAAASPSSPA